MKQQLSTFIIDREDQPVDPITLVTEGLSIGRLPDCELALNHPTVSRLHAGIKEVDGQFYVFNLSPSNATTVNGRLVEEREALADGDIIQIGPFFIYVGHDRKALTLRVIYQTAVNIGDTEVLDTAPEEPPVAAAVGASDADSDEALNVFWQKRKREAGKITRPSPLRPHAPPRLGKARFNWTPTRDLVRPWPYAILTWAAVLVALLTVIAAFTLKTAFSPTPVSDPHTRSAMLLRPVIAKEPNGSTCTSCHSVKIKMNDACASCHQTEAFVATTTPPHEAAGIGCTACHTEHKGENFRPGLAAVSASFQPGLDPNQTCAGCHNDNNKRLFNGKSVHTPHGGTFGYPVTEGQPNGHWTWMGIDKTELAQKPQQVQQILASWPAKNEDQKLSAQFHALHLHRVRAIGGLPGNSAGELSCSSCHKSLGAALDRTTPRTTCAVCHNGYTDPQTKQAVIAQDKPNCNSCHVQHVQDKRHWNPSLFSQPPAPQTARVAPTHEPNLLAATAR